MIRLLWRLCIVCIAIAVVVYGVAFNYYNSQQAGLDLVFTQLPLVPLGVIVVASLLIGFVLALLVCMFSIARLRLRNSLLKTQLSQLKNE